MVAIRLLGVTVVLALALAYPSITSAATIKTVALKTGLAPLPGSTYARFRDPVIGDGVPDRVAVYSRNRGGARCIFKLDTDVTTTAGDSTAACQRDPSPDGATFNRLGDPTINAASEAAWSARLTFGRTGVYRKGPGPSQVVAFIGDPVPLPGTGLLQTLTLGRITSGGDVVFLSTIAGGAVVLGGEVNQGIFRCTGGDGNCHNGTGTLQTLVLVNDPLPDRPGRKFCTLNTVAASSFGIAFRATTKLDCANAVEVPLLGGFRMPFAGAIVTIALEGEPSNPNPPGTLYRGPGDGLSINDGGFVAFRSGTSGLINTLHLFLCDPATCPAISPADAAVSAGDFDGSGNALTLLSGPALSAAGDFAFSSKLRGTSRSGVYVRRLVGPSIETIALSNDSIPDLAGGIFVRFNQPGMSPAGKVAFRARIVWPVSRPSRYGIFAFE